MPSKRATDMCVQAWVGRDRWMCCQARVSVSATDWDIAMGSLVGKDWYKNIGCVIVAVPRITSRGSSRGTVSNILLLIEEPKKEIGNVSKRVKYLGICTQPQRWLGGVLRERGWRGTSSNSRAFRKASICLIFSWFRPWWEFHYNAFEHWDIFVCWQLLN